MLRKYPRFLSRTGVGVCSLVLAGLLVDETRGAIAEFEGVRYHVFRVDPAAQEIRLYWRDAVGNPFKQFRALDQSLRAQGERLLFAMNAGIYEPGWVPAGLHIEQGTELRPLNQQGPPPRPPGKSTPNFYLLPNGVFYLLPDGRAGVRETQAFAAAGLPPRLAVQSGPLLLADGKIHPVFDPTSKSRLIRNGVGVDRQGQVHFVATDRSELGRINFHTFARLFQSLGCDDALYLDGDISEFYLRSDAPAEEIPVTTDFGAIFAVTEPVP
jgi:uncharacterized protein YigE (DUF2233 family)